MRFIFSFLLLFFYAYAQDPYKNVINYTLDNGMQVYLNPSKKANNLALDVQVKVGSYAEDKETLGASHLLEHLLFRSEKLKKNETYLQILEENGAKPNGETGYFETDYFASIDAPKGPWMVELFSRIVGDRNVLALDIDTERKTVAVEIGKVSFLKTFLGFDAEQFFSFYYFPQTPLYKSEFNLSLPPFSRDKERIATKTLTIKKLQKFYDDYYYPENMVLFVAGNFDIKKMKDIIEKSFGSFKRRNGKKLEKPQASMSDSAYYKVPKDSLDSKAIITMGTKYNNLSLKERITLISYIDDLALRLMKELRNLQGKTYTVSTINDKYVYAGIAGITLDTTKDDFESTYAYTKKIIEKETRNLSLSKADYKRIMNYFYQQHFQSIKSDADTLLDIAMERHEHLSRYKTSYEPYKAFIDLDYESYIHNLQMLFEPNKSFTVIERENLFFENDTFFLALLSFVMALFMIHALYSTKQNKLGIIIQAKINQTFFYRLYIVVMIILAFIALVLITTPLDNVVFPYFNLFNGLNLYPYYIWILFVKAPFIAWVFYFAAGVPKKELLFNGKALVLLGLRSKVISTHDIQSIQIIHSDWKAILFTRQRHYGWAWRKNKHAMQITTPKSIYVFWITDANAIKEIINLEKHKYN